MPMRVTITGADDKSDPDELARLSETFPFVEWGILYSEKRKGSPRYPSLEWFEWLYSAAAGTRMNLALHLCGGVARKAAASEAWGGARFSPAFKRLQLNGYLAPVLRSSTLLNYELILQVREHCYLPFAVFNAQYLGGGTSILYDPSGGRGVTAGYWPDAVNGVAFGYAGGIDPHSARAALESAAERGGTWIDMESGVRTADRLDLDKVRAVLEATTEAPD